MAVDQLCRLVLSPFQHPQCRASWDSKHAAEPATARHLAAACTCTKQCSGSPEGLHHHGCQLLHEAFPMQVWVGGPVELQVEVQVAGLAPLHHLHKCDRVKRMHAHARR